MTDEKTNAEPSGASGGSIAFSDSPWRRCCDELPQAGVYVVAVWNVFGKTSAHVVRRGTPAWYSDKGVEMICPSFWAPLPAVR